MKTPSVSQLLGVSVLLLSGLTVSAVSLNVSPNLQQFLERDSVSLSCVDDGQTVDGTVKRTKGDKTEDCITAGSSFGKVDGFSCIILSLDQTDSAGYWCETSSGQMSDQINITVTDGRLSLEIPALPVMAGSDVTLRCRKRNGDTVAAYFFKNNEHLIRSRSEHIISKVQQSDEGLYSCSTDEFESPQSWLRVRDPPTTTSAPPTTTLCSSTTTSPPPPPPASPLYPLPPCVSVIRLCLHLVVFCPYCTCTIMLALSCRSRRTGHKPAVSTEMTRHAEGGHGLDEEYDDVIADVTTEHEF